MKKNLLILAVIAVIITGLIMFTAKKDGGQTTNGSGNDGNLQGKQAPDFELKDIAGKTVKLSDYRGRAVVLNFWATWCGPCRSEMPWFADMEKQYQAKGVEVIGVAMDENPNAADIARFAKEVGVNYTVLLGQDSTGDAYGVVHGLPVTFYIDSTGKIVTQGAGLPANEGEIEENIKALLDKKSAQADAHAGKQAPDFELKTLEGKKVKLSDYRGKAVLLNFWATWCGPCREETPWLVDLQNQYRAQGFQILAVASNDSDADDIREFSKRYGLNYTVLAGKNSVEDAYEVQGLPTSIFIDPSGKMVTQVLGLPDTKSEIEDNIKLILNKQPVTVASANLASGETR